MGGDIIPTMKDLQGRVALVTGASRGIGKAIAEAFAREGAELIICSSNAQHMATAKTDLEALGAKVTTYTLDATKPEEVRAMFTDVVSKRGSLDILVNNIGRVMEHAKFEELSDEQWLATWQLNFMTAVSFTRAALPFIKKSPAGRIINISSTAGRQPGNFNPHYGAAKSALETLTKYLANELAGQKILVNAIAPSTVNGGIWETHIADKSQRENVSLEEATRRMEDEVKKKTPLGEVGTPQDVAELAVFLASDRAKFITGSCISVDGGLIKFI
jgi:3-oxoacyl-[acyl-carrier protein] reductase